MVNRDTIYNCFIAHVNDNIVMLSIKKEYYTKAILEYEGKLELYKEILERNSKEFNAIYSIDLEDIDNSYSTIIYHNQVNIPKTLFIASTVEKLIKINSSYDKHTIFLIKTLTDNYFELSKNLKEYKRYLRLIDDKLSFYNKYKDLSRNIVFYILTNINRYYEEAILNGETISLGHHIGFIKVVPKNVNGKTDWTSSFKYKDMLLEQGKIPYDGEDAKLAKKQGKKYKGVKWFVYFENETQHYINWYCYSSRLPNKDCYSFKPTRYDNTGYKKKDLPTIFTTVESMRKAKLGFINKLNVLLNANEMQFIKYVKNDI